MTATTTTTTTTTTTAHVTEPDDLPSLDHVQVHLIDSVDEAAAFMRWLGERHGAENEVAVDTEATGLSPETDRVRLVQFGDPMTGWVIPFERWAGVVDDAMTRYDGWITMHNAPYDVAMLRTGDVHVPIHRVRDTRLMAHVLSSTESLALKKLCAKHVDPRAAASQQRLDEALGSRGAWTWETIPVSFEEYWTYAGFDTVLTARLSRVLYPRVMADAPRSYDLEMAVAWVCEKMMRRGTRVDRPRLTELVEKLSVYVRDVEEWCVTHYGVKPGQNVSVANRLIADGVRLTKKTDGGAWSLDKEVLKSLTHPLAKAVFGRRKMDKLVGTYLRTYLEMSERDGLIHPSINTVGGTQKNQYESGGSGRGVRSGRMSMSEPNLQNVPVRTSVGKLVRDVFIPREDHTWIKSDFDQIEMRLLAHFAQEEGMIRAFRTAEETGGDFFVEMAREIFQDPTITKSDPRRQPVKNSGYAKIYGAGIPQFAKTAGMYTPEGELDVAGAARFINRFDQLYPGVRQWQNGMSTDSARQLREEGQAWVRSPLTGRRHVADRGREYALGNYMIQGAGGEVMKIKLVEADQAGLGDFMLFPVHDEINLDVPREQLHDAVTTLRDVMNDENMLSVPITASIGVGERWGSVEDI